MPSNTPAGLKLSDIFRFQRTPYPSPVSLYSWPGPTFMAPVWPLQVAGFPARFQLNPIDGRNIFDHQEKEK